MQTTHTALDTNLRRIYRLLRNIFVKDIVSRNARRAMFFNGLPEMKIENIQVENAFITAEFGAELSNSNNVKFKNVHVEPENGAALILKDVESFTAENFTNPEKTENSIRVSGTINRNIVINRVKY